MIAEPPQVDAKGLYTAAQAAQALGVSKRTVYRWESEGRLRLYVRKGTGRRVYKGSDLLRLWGAVI